MRHDDDGALIFHREQQIFNLRRGDGIERRAGLVQQQHFRIDRQRARDAQTLLLAARQRVGRFVQFVLDFVPQRRAAQALSTISLARFLTRPFTRGPYAMFSKIDFGNGLGRWKTIPTRRRKSVTSIFRMFCPSSAISPSRRVLRRVSLMRFRLRRKVDLPQPDGPISAVTLFVGNSSEMSCNA